MAELAINGGPKAVPEGMIKPWPPVTDLDRRYVLESLANDVHTYGPNCRKLEEEFAAWNGNRFAILTNSGTAALHMAIAACGCGAGDHVLVPAYSWSSSVTCALHHNCVPVFVDVRFDTINIDEDKIETAITPRTRAILVVHLHGMAVNMDKVCAIARKHGLKVIEDCCQAHGAQFRGRKVGLWGDVAAFSLNQNKCLTSGEGGVLVTDDRTVCDNARMIWSFGETRTPAEDRDYHAYALGWMYRSSDLAAAFGRAQLTRLDAYLEIQKKNAQVLLDGLADVPGLILPAVPEGCTPNWYNFQVRIDADALGWNGPPSRLRDAIMQAIQAEGVPAGIYQRFILPDMTVFKAKNAYGRGCPWSCPFTEPVEYDSGAFPGATKHLETHFGMTTPLRAPNSTDVASAVTEGIRKVFENTDRLALD
ncbi:MAG: DegT/DnrJ/EryC1/StrS family aminotransferase [Kiritimatiellaeota bacterium]|nr:DegT/DnrJ/EryC1/StrS family aminotransferase [Kiritimatiellota bacterium]